MNEYFGRNYSSAIELFTQVQKLLRVDSVSERMLRESYRCLKEPPGPEWDGTERMETK
jgi:hypothetical protein